MKTKKKKQTWDHLRYYLVLGVVAFLIGCTATTNYEALKHVAQPTYNILNVYYYSRDAQLEKFTTVQEKIKTETVLNHITPQPITFATIESVNNIVNAIPYKLDIDNYQMTEYWASPNEMWERQAGDCEDYAIFKYEYLKRMGMPENYMRIFVVKAPSGVHAILVVYHEGRYLVLDNANRYVLDTSVITSYKPIFAINKYGMWVANP